MFLEAHYSSHYIEVGFCSRTLRNTHGGRDVKGSTYSVENEPRGYEP